LFAIMAQLENPPRELKSGQVLFRFCVRITILVGFSAFGGVGFARSLAALAAMSTILCAVLASVKREAVFGAVLNHWDEAVAYAALYFLIGGLNLPAPV
jgi:Na+/H+ antiporter NhaD/arsenite permease-like protein